MSKIEVIGPKDRLLPVLATIRRSETLQLDATIQPRIADAAESSLTPLAMPGARLGERAAYRELRDKIDRLLALWPDAPSGDAVLPPHAALPLIAGAIDERLAQAEDDQRRKSALQSDSTAVNASLAFMTAAATLVPESVDGGHLDVIAVAVRDRAALDRLTAAASALPLVTAVRSAPLSDGSYISLLTTEKALADRLRQQLSDEHIPEVALPPYLHGRPLAEKIALLRARSDELAAAIAAIGQRQRDLAQTWRHAHAALRGWLTGELAMLDASTLAYESSHCFVLFGWVPTRALATLASVLRREYGDDVVVQEKPILLRDLEHVPVAIHNPRSLRPFELLVTLLPPPRYTSFDPTPIVALCFPLFFGLMVGDVGHGVVLLVAAVAARRWRRDAVWQQAAWVLAAAAAFTIVFGVVFGECFGEAGAQLLGLDPFIDRRTSWVPMLVAAVGIGFVHVSLGLLLGVAAALAAGHRTDAVFRATSLAMLVGIAALLVTFAAPAIAPARRPLAVALVLTVPLLLISGGLVAPFELVRHIGNVVSYARLMAIGLASVLLAYVANGLATAVESVWLAIAFAVLLHGFNIVLGVFGPTIHALRLHYVEFFSKFYEPAHTRYEPLKAP